MPTRDASLILSLLGIFNTVGRLIAGWLADRPCADSLVIYNVSAILAGLLTCLVSVTFSFNLLCLYAASFGVLIGSYLYRSYRHVTSPQSNLRRAASQWPHWLQWDAPNSPPKLPLPFDDHLIHPSLDQPPSPPQTASGFNQPFCHNTLCGQTDRQTDCPGECSVT